MSFYLESCVRLHFQHIYWGDCFLNQPSDFLHSMPLQILWMQPCLIFTKRSIGKDAIPRGQPGGYAVCSSLRDSLNLPHGLCQITKEQPTGVSTYYRLVSFTLPRKMNENRKHIIREFWTVYWKRNHPAFLMKKSVRWKQDQRRDTIELNKRVGGLRAFPYLRDRMTERWFYTWSETSCVLPLEELLKVFPSKAWG